MYWICGTQRQLSTHTHTHTHTPRSFRIVNTFNTHMCFFVRSRLSTSEKSTECVCVCVPSMLWKFYWYCLFTLWVCNFLQALHGTPYIVWAWGAIHLNIHT